MTTTQINRAVIIVLDAVGIGEMPDAAQFGDQGSNTLVNTARAVGGLRLPTMEKMGLGKITPIEGMCPCAHVLGNYGKMAELSGGKDTTNGHWEIAGLPTPTAFPTYPNGFPMDIITPFVQKTGRGILGNKPASGTAIIEELGEQHLRTGDLIVYTSADSVFQIAAHEDIVPIEELYRYCQIARELLTGPHAVGRVIARPFTGTPGQFNRTERRHDFSLEPTGPTLLTRLKEAGYPVIGVGKIEDIFAGVGITKAVHSKGNPACITATIQEMLTPGNGLIFTNLVDTDMIYGHRNDPVGFARSLAEFDEALPRIMANLGQDDLLIITADHGCDPTTPSTDHSREYVPLLVYGPGLNQNVNLGTRSSFADITATLLEGFGLGIWPVGTSFWTELTKK